MTATPEYNPRQFWKSRDFHNSTRCGLGHFRLLVRTDLTASSDSTSNTGSSKRPLDTFFIHQSLTTAHSESLTWVAATGTVFAHSLDDRCHSNFFVKAH